jgi:hypothetical protein
MLKKLVFTLSLMTYPLLNGSGKVYAEQLQLIDDAPKTYTVVKGDTLWDISAVFLEQPWLWPKLWRVNPEVSNPHLIYPGDILRLIFDENGEPVIVVEKPKPSYRLSPEKRKVVDDSAIGTIPLEVIAPYLTYANLLTEADLSGLPRVLGSDEGYRSSVTGFKVYVDKNLELASTFAMYDKGEELFDPETEESIGFYMTLTGTAQVVNSGDMYNKVPATMKVNTVKQEIHSGNYVLPVNKNQQLSSVFDMKAVDESIKGRIIKAISDNREFGKFEVIMINKGAKDNVATGNVFGIKRKSPGVLDGKDGPTYKVDASRWERIMGEGDYNMPEEPIGEVMVFKVYEQASMAIILNTQKPARLQDILTAPE